MSGLRPYPAPSREAIDVVLAAVCAADYGARSMKLAAVLPLLVVEAARVGELVAYDAVAGGGLRNDAGEIVGRWSAPVAGLGMRAEWFERLAVAITTGRIDELEPKRIVEILLQPKA